MSEPTTSLAEQLSGAYRVERPLGEGGMATVYLAQDLKHQRPVALKVLKPELAHALGPERFRREITTAARLQHPHILSVFDSGETAAGQLWFTMPYVNGETLRERLRRERRLPVDEALRIMREAAQALQHAHDEGIVHRDVKPENLLLTRDGSTLVADFGIARALGSDGTGTDTTGEQLTRTGTAIGTPMYMAPEQGTGQRTIDARADQYALAATLFEMLAGAPPFTGETAGAIIAKRFTSPVPSVRAQRPEVPAVVDQALQRALALAPEDRFDTIHLFARAAGAVTATPSGARTAAIPAPPTPTSERLRRSPVVLGVGALALLGLVAGGMFARRAISGGALPSAAAVVDSAHTLAVLPFENLGDTADAYFADGLTDDLRGKLTGVPGLLVIARSSSESYRGSTKPVPQIAQELGARYLLTGTVRWDKSGGGRGRVRVSPELIEITPAGQPTSKWQQPFDAPLTDVFEVQSGIAAQVAGALDVALGGAARQALAERPTRDLEAYDLFLRGHAATQVGGAMAWESAAPLFAAAVQRDSTFGRAWAALATIRSLQYVIVVPRPATAAQAREAVAQAWRFAPTDPGTYAAAAMVATRVEGDARRARALLQEGLARAPNEPVLLRALGAAEFALGDVVAARQTAERAVLLDPRSADALLQLARTALHQRDGVAARAAAERAWALAPTPVNLETRILAALQAGDLGRARELVREGIASFGRTETTTYEAIYGDLYWVLEPADQAFVLGLGPTEGHFAGQRASWALVQAQLRHLRGDSVGLRAYADTARVALERDLAEAPDNAEYTAFLGLALAYLGRPEEARSKGERGVALAAPGRHAMAMYTRLLMVRIHLLTGDRARALEGLEALLQQPNLLTPAWLRIDPTFAPLRGDPRFERLVAGR